MKSPLVIALFAASMAPLYTHAEQPDRVKLKADAQKVVGIIKGDKAKTRLYCEINDLGEQIGEAEQNNEDIKAEALSQQVTELEKKLGPEYLALAKDLNNVADSPEGREIDLIFAPLDDSCQDYAGPSLVQPPCVRQMPAISRLDLP
jgi:hypothetical protein